MIVSKESKIRVSLTSLKDITIINPITLKGLKPMSQGHTLSLAYSFNIWKGGEFIGQIRQACSPIDTDRLSNFVGGVRDASQ
jgi:hypothetical protein